MNDECPGEGSCHGCARWCDHCGDVDTGARGATVTLEAIFVLLETPPEVPPHREERKPRRWARPTWLDRCRRCDRSFQQPGPRMLAVGELTLCELGGQCAECCGWDPWSSAAEIAEHARSNP